MTTSKSEALQWAGGREDCVIRMALRTDRYIESETLYREHAAELERIENEMGRLVATAPSSERTEKLVTLAHRHEVLSDIGRYTAARGYHARQIPTRPGAPEHWVIFNRTALAVQD